MTRAALVAALPLAWAFGGITGLIVVAGLLGFGGAFFDPNLGSMTPDLVKPEDVPTVVALMDLTGRIARVAGPGTAGALLTLVSASILFFWIDATTFILSALALLLLPRALAGTGRTVAHQARDVAKTQNTLRARQILREHPRARVMLGMHTVGIVAGAAGFALPALLTTRMDAVPALRDGHGRYGCRCTWLSPGAGKHPSPPIRGRGVLPDLGRAGSPHGRYGFRTESARSHGDFGPRRWLIPISSVLMGTYMASHPTRVRRRLITVDQTLIRSGGTASMLIVPALAAANPTVAYVAASAVTVAAAVTGCVWIARSPQPQAEPSTSQAVPVA